MAENFKNAGNAMFKKGKFFDAIESYNKAIELSGNVAAYWSNRSACYYSIGNFKDATFDAQRAIEIDENFIKGYSRLASALKAQGQMSSAIDVINIGLTYENDNKVLLSMRDSTQDKSSCIDKPKVLPFTPCECNNLSSICREDLCITNSGKKENDDVYCQEISGLMKNIRRENNKKEMYQNRERLTISELSLVKNEGNENNDVEKMKLLEGFEKEVFIELKWLIARIESKDYLKVDIKGHVLQGTFKQLINKQTFADLLYPGTPLSTRKSLPQSLHELLVWKPVQDIVAKRKVEMTKHATKIYNGVKMKGEARGEKVTEDVQRLLIGQILQETLARELIRIVNELAVKVSAIYAQMSLTKSIRPMTTSSDRNRQSSIRAEVTDWIGKDLIEMDQIESSVLETLFGDGGCGIQDEFLGVEWTDIILKDLLRYVTYNKMTNLGSISSSHNSLVRQCQVTWIEGDDNLSQQYPALAECIKHLHALPFELNARASDIPASGTCSQLNLVQAASGATCVLHCVDGQSPVKLMDTNKQIELQTGMRMFCAYYLIPEDDRNGTGPSTATSTSNTFTSNTPEVKVICNDRYLDKATKHI